MHHVVQNGLFSEFGFKKLINALEGQELPYTVVDVVPSSHEISPDITANGPIMAGEPSLWAVLRRSEAGSRAGS